VEDSNSAAFKTSSTPGRFMGVKVINSAAQEEKEGKIERCGETYGIDLINKYALHFFLSARAPHLDRLSAKVSGSKILPSCRPVIQPGWM
jgi:hypothetical protein